MYRTTASMHLRPIVLKTGCLATRVEEALSENADGCLSTRVEEARCQKMQTRLTLDAQKNSYAAARLRNTGESSSISVSNSDGEHVRQW